MKNIKLTIKEIECLEKFFGEQSIEETKIVLSCKNITDDILREKRTSIIRIDNSVYYLYSTLCDIIESNYDGDDNHEYFNIEVLDTEMRDLICYTECILNNLEAIGMVYDIRSMSGEEKEFMLETINKFYELLLE